MSANQTSEQCPTAEGFSGLLKDFEPRLLRHELDILGTRVKVHMHSLIAKSYLFYERVLQADNGANLLKLTEREVSSLSRLQLLLYFCHFDRVRDMRISLIREVLEAARQFECASLIRYAESFVLSELSVQTVCGIWLQVRDFPRLKAARLTREFLLKHFLSAARQPDFRQFSVDTIVDLLRDDWLNVWLEDTLVEPLLAWLSDRLTPLWDQICLLAAMRFDRLNERSRRALSAMDAYQYFSSFRRSKMFANMCQHSAAPRLAHEYLLLLGGCDGNNGSVGRLGEASCAAYLVDPRSGLAAFSPRLQLPQPRAAFACCCHDSVVFVLGGWMGSTGAETNTCLALDLGSNKNAELAWVPIAGLHNACCFPSAVVCDSVVYAVGGENGLDGCLDTVQAFQIFTDDDEQPDEDLQKSAVSLQRRVWNLREPLPRARSCPGLACVAGWGGVGSVIIACGGYLEPSFEQPCRLVDSYSPADNQWTRLDWGLMVPRGGPCLLPLNCEQQQQQSDGKSPPTRRILVLGGNASVGGEWLNLCPRRQPTWVTDDELPGQLQLPQSCTACVVDSRWLVAHNSEPADQLLHWNNSMAIPIDQLQSAASSSQWLLGQRGDVTDVSWLRGLGLTQFGIAAVPVSSKLIDESEFS